MDEVEDRIHCLLDVDFFTNLLVYPYQLGLWEGGRLNPLLLIGWKL
jgi:hypothetical protein